MLALLLASSSLWAFPGRGEESVAEVPAIAAEEAIQKEPTPAPEPQRTGSGEASKPISGEPRSSLEKAQEIVGSASTIVVGGKSELEVVLDTLGSQLGAAEESSRAKDAEIDALRNDLAKAEGETGTKAYLMLDGIVGFADTVPQFGVGLTVGTRLGNSLMLELGADYMIGGMDGYNSFDIDNFQFRCGVGWMF